MDIGRDVLVESKGAPAGLGSKMVPGKGIDIADEVG